MKLLSVEGSNSGIIDYVLVCVLRLEKSIKRMTEVSIYVLYPQSNISILLYITRDQEVENLNNQNSNLMQRNEEDKCKLVEIEMSYNKLSEVGS